MTRTIIDSFNHCLPPGYVEACRRYMTQSLVMFERAVKIPGMTDLDQRLQIIKQFPGYKQILSIASPSPEAIANPQESSELARTGNDSLAEWRDLHPDIFPGFIATLPMNNPDACMIEAKRAVEELGALGVQIYTHINGQPLDQPEHLPLFEYMSEIGRPIWLHPLRPSSRPDYVDESISKYDLWWAFGWPHETSVCAGRLVFAGIFDKWPNLKIITHHAGGTIPMMEGRLNGGLESLGNRYAPEQAYAAKTNLKEKPINAFRKFYADTATFGSRIGIDAGVAFFGKEKTVFATDFPFSGIEENLKAVDGLGSAVMHRNIERITGLNGQ